MNRIAQSNPISEDLSAFFKNLCLLVLLCAVMPLSAPAQTFTTLVAFDVSNGTYPDYGTLVQGFDGQFYGTAHYGGFYNYGTLFALAPTGALTTIHSFDPFNLEGLYPGGGLVQASSGNLYGTTYEGGYYGYGSVFAMPLKGELQPLYSFCFLQNCIDGSLTNAGLVEGSNGGFFGTAPWGGAYYNGTVFEISPSGKFSLLYTFCSRENCVDGANPVAGLIQGADGNFYGTTSRGGFYGSGTVFEITPAGKLTTLYSFCADDQSQCLDGAIPYGMLVQDANGNLFGTTSNGGHGGARNGAGTIFEITSAGKFATLHRFCSRNNCLDGATPWAGLTLATDGNFYGTTAAGGLKEEGTIFEITPSGRLTTLHSFCHQSGCTDGEYPNAGLLQATNGTFYGTTSSGGSSDCSGGCGTVFSLDVGLGPFVAFVIPGGKFGDTAQILGQNLTGTTNVTFSGIPASFRLVSDTHLTAVVPSGATTGPVVVTTPTGVMTSKQNFRIVP